MMKRTAEGAVIIKDVKIGEGIPKICVSLMGRAKSDIIKEANALIGLPVDLAEWRLDRFEAALDHEAVCAALEELDKAAGHMPLLAAYRRTGGYGEKLSVGAYRALYEAILKTEKADLIDVELSIGENEVRELVSQAHAAGAGVVVSSHDFEKTPPREELEERFDQMRKLGADIAKIGVMPSSPKDVLNLLAAGEAANSQPGCPIVAISMADMGRVSRLACQITGSAITFASAGAASAPGQIDAVELRRMLALLYRGGEA